jgi:undecaprenyl-diphosphatase
MNLLEALIFGLTQGLTEFLPVSSSGHLALLGRLFGTDKALMFTLATWMHAGTLVAVFVVMRREIAAIFRDILGPLTWKLVLASIPALLMVLLLGDFLEDLFAGGYLGISFILSGLILLGTQLLVSRKPDNRKAIGNREAIESREDAGVREAIGSREALIAGIGQAIAVAPGISRSGLSISALLLSGVARTPAIRFAFLMAIPAILGGFVMDVIHLLQDGGDTLSALGLPNILAGVAAAALSGYLAMRFMIRRLHKRGFMICAAYVLALGALILVDQFWTRLVF